MAEAFGQPRDAGDGRRDASAKLMSWEKEGGFAWHTTLRADEVSWSRWRARYRIERSFHEDGTWRDSTRVNLGQKDRHLLVFAQYPAGVSATEDGVDLLVRKLKIEDEE